jgi:CysZ protein
MKNFLRGFFSPLKSIEFILKNPKLLIYLILPLCMSLGTLATTFFLWGMFSDSIMEWLNISEDGVWNWVYVILMWILYAVFSLYFFTFFGMILATPFNDILSRRVLMLRGMSGFSELGLIEGAIKSLIEVLKLTGLKLICMVIAFFIPPLPIVVLLLFIGYDYFDYPLNHKYQGLKVKMKVILKDHKAVFLGFASIYTLMFMVPFAGLILMPLAVVGASLLFESNEK